LTGVREPMLDVTVCISAYWSVLRVDLSAKYVIVTREDPQAPGIRADEGTSFYEAYTSDLNVSASQSRTLQKLPPEFEGPLDVHEIRKVFGQLEVRHEDLDDSFLNEITQLMQHSSHQYD